MWWNFRFIFTLKPLEWYYCWRSQQNHRKYNHLRKKVNIIITTVAKEGVMSRQNTNRYCRPTNETFVVGTISKLSLPLVWSFERADMTSNSSHEFTWNINFWNNLSILKSSETTWLKMLQQITLCWNIFSFTFKIIFDPLSFWSISLTFSFNKTSQKIIVVQHVICNVLLY